MPNIKYSLGGTEFDAVPEEMTDRRDLPVKSEATLARGMVHSVGVAKEKIILRGKYMTTTVKSAIGLMFDACMETGASVVFNDGYTERDVLIGAFDTVPIVGKTEGCSFRIELVVV